MSVAALAIDLQLLDALNYREVWFELARNICGLRTDLQRHNIPTINVAYFNAEFVDGARVTPDIGRMGAIQQTEQWKDFIQPCELFDFQIPVQQNDWVAIKTSPSACVQPLTGFLKDAGVRTLILSGLVDSDRPRKSSGFCIPQSAIDFRAFDEWEFRVIIAAEATNELKKSRGVALAERAAHYSEFGVEIMPIRDILALARRANLAAPAF